MKRALCGLLMLAWPLAAAAVQVDASGAVTKPGALNLPAGARLVDASRAAQPLPSAYVLGAAWLRPALRADQARLQAGVLYDLRALQLHASAKGDAALAQAATALRQQLAALPITGRAVPALLDPRLLPAVPAQNHLLADGDRLYYPARPHTIRVLGAVAQTCTLPLVPLRDARLYLAACPRSAAADRDTVYVIEPDGQVSAQGIALWNRGAPQALAPGAILYVPLRQRAAAKVDPALNADIAALLATQILPGPGAD